MPIEFNVLINPLHKDFSKLTIENTVRMDIDKRIIK
jgi:ribulose-5-phosphate 4-epimerase/fuculose-1-phosphate aldolase